MAKKRGNTVSEPYFDGELRLRCPGIFVTGTDTGVGKTVVSCAIAWSLRRQGVARVGVCKIMATGCRREREGLVSEDAEALAHFADCRFPLDIINPIRLVTPAAPAAAAEIEGVAIDRAELARSLRVLDGGSDALVLEGVGGLLVPVDPAKSNVTVLDVIRAVGYPVVVVCRAGLGTLNHTAMTVRLLRDSGCRVAGLVMNGYEPDTARHTDPSMASNRLWLERMTGAPMLAVLPRIEAGVVEPSKGELPAALLDAAGLVYWPDVLAGAAPVAG